MSNSTAVSTVKTTTVNPVVAVTNQLTLLLPTFNFWVSIVFLFPGFFLNLFTFLVFWRKKFWRNTTMGFFYSLYGLFTTISVLVGLLVFFPASVGYDLTKLNDIWACRIFSMLRAQVIQFNGYFTVFMTLDRTLNILYNKRFKFLKNYKILSAITVTLWVCVFIANIYQTWRQINVTYTTSKNVTVVSSVTCAYRSSAGQTANGYVSLIGRLVPSIANLVMNGFIIRALFKSKSNMRRVRDTKTKSRSPISRKELYFAYTLVSANFIFFVITLPHVFLSAIRIYNGFVTLPADFLALINQLNSYGSMGNYIFESIAFYINFSFNKIFRAEILSIVRVGRPTGSTTMSDAPNRSVNASATYQR